MITRLLFRVIGRVVLQGGGGILGGGGGGGGESRISITLPTYPPLPDDDEETPTEESPSTDQDGATAGSSDSTTPSPAVTLKFRLRTGGVRARESERKNGSPIESTTQNSPRLKDITLPHYKKPVGHPDY
ncbi:hypothetical protein AAG570_005781 [Ranatra chinensis]|uniref:Uncharacterized protein n=1 Tax=Ranatra chinensis TaxID=642074 RepID=A0ABD0XYG6_9HEMI